MPDWSGEIRRRLSAVPLPPEREAAIVDEVAQHLEDRYQTLLASGQPAAEAERRAWRELEGDDVLGRLLSATEPPRRPSLAGLEAAPRGRLLRGLWHDVRYAVRNLRKRSMLYQMSPRDQSGPTAAVIGIADARSSSGRCRWSQVRTRLLPLRIRHADARQLIHRLIANTAKSGRRDSCRGIAGQTSVSYGLALEGVAPRHLGTAILPTTDVLACA